MLSMNISSVADSIIALPGTPFAPVKGKKRKARNSDPVTGSMPAKTLGTLPCVTVRTFAELSSMSPSNVGELRICDTNTDGGLLLPSPQPDSASMMDMAIAAKSSLFISCLPFISNLSAAHNLRFIGNSTKSTAKRLMS